MWEQMRYCHLHLSLVGNLCGVPGWRVVFELGSTHTWQLDFILSEIGHYSGRWRTSHLKGSRRNLHGNMYVCALWATVPQMLVTFFIVLWRRARELPRGRQYVWQHVRHQLVDAVVVAIHVACHGAVLLLCKVLFALKPWSAAWDQQSYNI